MTTQKIPPKVTANDVASALNAMCRVAIEEGVTIGDMLQMRIALEMARANDLAAFAIERRDEHARKLCEQLADISYNLMTDD